MTLRARLSTLALCVLGVTSAAAAHVLVPFSRHSEHSTHGSHHSSHHHDAPAAPGFAYVVNVTVGTPGQELFLAISPLAGDTWVPNAETGECSSRQDHRHHRRYDGHDDGRHDYAQNNGHHENGYNNGHDNSRHNGHHENGHHDNGHHNNGHHENGNHENGRHNGNHEHGNHDNGRHNGHHEGHGHGQDRDASSACAWGSFNPSRSRSYRPQHRQHAEFHATAADGSHFSGSNFTDRLVVGDIELHHFPMGLVSSADRWMGVLGLGFNTSAHRDSDGVYPNFVDRLVASRRAATPAYSIWLDNAEGTSGGLLFGAIDRSRFSGDLVRLPADSGHKGEHAFSVTLAGINGTAGRGSRMRPIRSDHLPLDVHIGPAEPFSYLPDHLADRIADMCGARYDDSLSHYVIPCDAGEHNTAEIVFELSDTGGPTLSVETADLVLPKTVLSASRGFGRLDGTNTCLFGVQKHGSHDDRRDRRSPSDSYNLGNSVLRRTYLVFDLANNEIALAPVRFSSHGHAPSPSIVPFERYGDTVPHSTQFCDRDGRDCRGRSSNSGSGPGRSGSSDDGQFNTIAIVLGVVFGSLTVIAAIGSFVFWKRRRGQGKNAAAKEADDDETDQSDVNTGPPKSAKKASGPNSHMGRSSPSTAPLSGASSAFPGKQSEMNTPAPQLPAFETSIWSPVALSDEKNSSQGGTASRLSKNKGRDERPFGGWR